MAGDMVAGFAGRIAIARGIRVAAGTGITVGATVVAVTGDDMAGAGVASARTACAAVSDLSGRAAFGRPPMASLRAARFCAWGIVELEFRG